MQGRRRERPSGSPASGAAGDDVLTEAELTILRAAANIAREDAIAMATNATTHDERESVNAGLSVYLSVEKYLFARDNADRPFLIDERREEREELVAIDREQLATQAEERAYWQDEGLEHAERVTLETARWSR